MVTFWTLEFFCSFRSQGHCLSLLPRGLSILSAPLTIQHIQRNLIYGTIVHVLRITQQKQNYRLFKVPVRRMWPNLLGKEEPFFSVFCQEITALITKNFTQAMLGNRNQISCFSCFHICAEMTRTKLLW